MMRRLVPALVGLFLSAQAFGQAPLSIPDGTVLALGEYCYTITANKDGRQQPIGLTFQSVQRQQVNGVDALAIVVHQQLSNGKFDMRDSFLLHRKNLLPISLDTDRDGVPHVHLAYTTNRVTGWKMVDGKQQPIEITFHGPVWDGNLWGEIFAALPLQAGGTYHLPIYQYDSGQGSFYVNVTGKQKQNTPKGSVDAWRLQAGLKPTELVEYVVGSNPHLELAYSAGPSSQHLGGDCKDLR